MEVEGEGGGADHQSDPSYLAITSQKGKKAQGELNFMRRGKKRGGGKGKRVCRFFLWLELKLGHPVGIEILYSNLKQA